VLDQNFINDPFINDPFINDPFINDPFINDPGSDHVIVLDEIPEKIQGDEMFRSRTQYDPCFNVEYEQYQNKSRGLVCAIYSLFVAKEYFLDHCVSQRKNEENLERAVTVTTFLSVMNQKRIEEVVRDTDLDCKDIVRTTISLIDLEKEIPCLKEDFCVIFLKNSKYWVVIGDSNSGTYCIRDCHETYQHNFNCMNRKEFLNYLTSKYSMKTEFVIDGYVFTEYSKIEYIVIRSSFMDTFDQQINHMLMNQNIQMVPGPGQDQEPDPYLDLDSDADIYDEHDNNIMNNDQMYPYIDEYDESHQSDYFDEGDFESDEDTGHEED
jgi:hypothetical protein